MLSVKILNMFVEENVSRNFARQECERALTMLAIAAGDAPAIGVWPVEAPIVEAPFVEALLPEAPIVEAPKAPLAPIVEAPKAPLAPIVEPQKDLLRPIFKSLGLDMRKTEHLELGTKIKIACIGTPLSDLFSTALKAYKDLTAPSVEDDVGF
jgi:hypothetical protein